MLSDLGFIIHSEKSVLVPTQNIVFLGFVLNPIDMTVSLTKEKPQKIKTAILDFLRARRSTIRDLCKIIGMLVASFPAVSYGKLFYRQLENEKIIALKKSCGDFDSTVFLSPVAKLDLQWWVEIYQLPISHGHPDLVIETDASTRGWGCFCRRQNVRTGGPWEGQKQKIISMCVNYNLRFLLYRHCVQIRRTYISA